MHGLEHDGCATAASAPTPVAKTSWRFLTLENKLLFRSDQPGVSCQSMHYHSTCCMSICSTIRCNTFESIGVCYIGRSLTWIDLPTTLPSLKVGIQLITLSTILWFNLYRFFVVVVVVDSLSTEIRHNKHKGWPQWYQRHVVSKQRQWGHQILSISVQSGLQQGWCLYLPKRCSKVGPFEAGHMATDEQKEGHPASNGSSFCNAAEHGARV